MEFSNNDSGTDDGFVFYPNPAHDVLNFIFDESISHSINIRNALGQIVLQTETGLQEFKLNISELPRGIYFAEIKSGEKSVMKKIVKQ